jgi:hypothetical protein
MPLDEEWTSIKLFHAVTKAPWEDQSYLVHWHVGQPLGSVTSFAMLSITHNILLEAMSLSLGLGHSPYVVLGDDVVVFNKKLRKKYIAVFNQRGIPLSLHKSYEGRLSEFAGKMFVSNCIPFYTTDHSPLTWNSLFDWQSKTGIRIPWKHLPMQLRRKVESCVKEALKNLEGDFNTRKLASLAYRHAQSNLVCGAGSIQFQDSGTIGRPEVFFEYLASSEENPPAATLHTGITLIGNGHPVVLLNTKYAEKDGYFQRYRPVELPKWFKEKVRPCATDVAIRGGLSSVFGYCIR